MCFQFERVCFLFERDSKVDVMNQPAPKFGLIGQRLGDW